jgi:hypothetical protein
MLKIFLFSCFEYCQIWINILIDDHHLSNITIFLKKSPIPTMQSTMQAPPMQGALCHSFSGISTDAQYVPM